MNPRELFGAFVECALRRDGGAFAELFTEDAMMEFPFVPGGVPLAYAGRTAIRARAIEAWGNSPLRATEFANVTFTDGRDDVVVAEYEIRGTGASGAPFAARAVMRLQARDGRIAKLREYIDPVALLAARRTASPREVLHRYHAAMQSKSADALADLYAEDSIHEFSFFTSNRPRLVGREQVRESYAAGWRNHPLAIDEISDAFVYEATDPEVVIGQWRATGSIIATGARVAITGLLVLRVRAGRIVHTHDFMDGLGIAQALGRPPFAG